MTVPCLALIASIRLSMRSRQYSAGFPVSGLGLGTALGFKSSVRNVLSKAAIKRPHPAHPSSALTGHPASLHRLRGVG